MLQYNWWKQELWLRVDGEEKDHGFDGEDQHHDLESPVDHKEEKEMESGSKKMEALHV